MPDHPYNDFIYGVASRQGGDPFKLIALFKSKSDANAFVETKRTSSDAKNGWEFQYMPA